MSARRCSARRAATALLVAAAACSGPGDDAPLRREGPFGSLRDLVLFERADADGGAFFLDRFELTRGDWAEFAATPAGGDARWAVPSPLRPAAATLPMAFLDLRQARAVARWRRCRLPRFDEWTFACGRDAYPWGSLVDAARANTSDLGVFAPLPVGTFESGRNGDGPYDLIGNVAEWTETVPASWFLLRREVVPPMGFGLDRLQRTPALTVWLPLPWPRPVGLVVAAAGEQAPREVLGADFWTSMREGPQLRAPGDRSDAIGVRLCTTPVELLQALAPDVALLAGDDWRQVERFCRRRGHAAALRPWLDRVSMSPAARARLEGALTSAGP